jgi:gluconokinase
MLDKIRLNAAGRLPADYQANLGETHFNVFDARCCRFLRVSYAEIVRRVLAGEKDEAVAAWAEQQSGRTDEECDIWNAYLSKRGWRDDRSAALRERIAEEGLEGQAIETFFDFIDRDEGRELPRT